METYPQDFYPVHHSFETVVSAAIAAVVVIGLLWGLVELSQSRGSAASRLTAAERACAKLSYARDRETCIKQWLHSGRTED